MCPEVLYTSFFPWFWIAITLPATQNPQRTMIIITSAPITINNVGTLLSASSSFALSVHGEISIHCGRQRQLNSYGVCSMQVAPFLQGSEPQVIRGFHSSALYPPWHKQVVSSPNPLEQTPPFPQVEFSQKV